MYKFNYVKAKSPKSATKAFQDSEDATYLAGGMTLIPTLKQRLAAPSDVVDLSALKDLNFIEAGENTIEIGALTPHARVGDSEDVKKAIPALASLAGQIGDPAVRTRGTLGGSIANSDPAADYPAAVLALGAKIKTNQREIPADDYFIDLFETALEEGELITAVSFPIPERAAYAKFPNPVSRYAMVGVFVADFGEQIRVGVTGAGPCAFRFKELEKALEEDFTPKVMEGIEIKGDDFNDDIHGSAAYRVHLLKVMAEKAIAKCQDN